MSASAIRPALTSPTLRPSAWKQGPASTSPAHSMARAIPPHWRCWTPSSPTRTLAKLVFLEPCTSHCHHECAHHGQQASARADRTEAERLGHELRQIKKRGEEDGR